MKLRDLRCEFDPFEKQCVLWWLCVFVFVEFGVCVSGSSEAWLKPT